VIISVNGCQLVTMDNMRNWRVSGRVLTMRKRITRTVAGVILVLGTVFGLEIPATVAHASGHAAICDSLFECLNAWNGGPYVNTYGPSAYNDHFLIQPIAGRCKSGSDYTTPNCPFSGVPGNLLIIQIEYYNNPGNCLGDLNGDPGNARASAFDACNDPNTGFGGSYGTVFYELPPTGREPTGCFAGWYDFESFHWQGGGLYYSGSGNDRPYYLNVNPASCMPGRN
jgi:hypothetical protein